MRGHTILRAQAGCICRDRRAARRSWGEVVAVGPGKRLENDKRAEMSVRKGDTVVYGKYAGTEVEIKGAKHLILRESELLGVIEG